MDREDLLALGLIRQIDEEQFIEAPFADQLRRQRRHIVASRGDKDGRLAILHPRKKRSQQARRNSGIDRRRIRPAPGKYFLQFVNPENARCQSLSDLKDFTNALLRLADELVVDRRRIELHERKLPLAGHGACAQRLAAALHPEDDYAVRRLQTEGPRGIFPCASSCGQPRLQILQPADVRHIVGRFHELQHLGALEQGLLHFKHVGRDLRTHGIPGDQRLRNRSLGLFLRQSTQVFGDQVQTVRIESALQGMSLRNADQSFVDELPQSLPVRQRQLEEFHQPAQLRRNLNLGRGQDNGLPVRGKSLTYIAEPANHDRIVHMTMQIFENEGRLHRDPFQV